MGAKSKCSLLGVLMFCAFLISVGLLCNVFTIICIPSSISQQMLNTIAVAVEPIVEPIIEEIKEKVPKWDMPALLRVGSFWIFILDLVIILSTMFPKLTFKQCKEMHDGKKCWYDVAFLASYTVSV